MSKAAISTEALRRFREAKDVATVILAAAVQSQVISEITPDWGGAFPRFMAMTDADRAALAKLTGRPNKKVIDVAARLAGSSYEAARTSLVTEMVDQQRSKPQQFRVEVWS